MTATPDTVNAAEATNSSAPPTTTPDQVTSLTTPATSEAAGPDTRTQVRPTRPDMAEETTSTFQRVLVGVLVAVPFLALIAAIPLLWGWGLNWHDVVRGSGGWAAGAALAQRNEASAERLTVLHGETVLAVSIRNS